MCFNKIINFESQVFRLHKEEWIIQYNGNKNFRWLIIILKNFKTA